MTGKLTHINNPLHLALFLPSLGGGGAERVTINLANELMRSFDISVDLVLAKAEGRYLNSLPLGIQLFDLKKSRMLSAIFPLLHYIRSAKPDIILTGLTHANIATLIASHLSRHKMKVIIVNHVHLSSALSEFPILKRTIFRLLIRFLYPRANAIINVSYDSSLDLIKHTYSSVNKVHVIPNPVVGEELFNKARQPVNHPWLLNGHENTVVAVGSLISVKDFPMLLKAISILKDIIPVKLIMLGEGEQRNMLEESIKELGLSDIVDMPGFVDNPYSYISKANVLALSSRREALPTVLIEAMACGTPIVSTDCPCGPREILANGKYGRLVPVGDPAAMADALLDVIHNRPTPPPPSAWNRYLMKNVAEEYWKLFNLLS